MKADAEANAEADKKAKETAEKINGADAMIFQTESQLKEFGDKLSADKKGPIESALEELKKAHESKDLAQIDAGADVLYAERAGVIEAAVQEDLIAVGNMSDQSADGPDHVVTSVTWNMTPTVEYIIDQVAGGTYTAQDLKDFNMVAKGGATLAPINEDVAGGIPADAALKITGAVETEIGWTEDQIRAMDTVEAESTNKSGETSTYTGVSINDLLDKAGFSVLIGLEVLFRSCFSRFLVCHGRCQADGCHSCNRD